MSIGLVLEGGAMRGMYTAGVLDVFLDNNIEVDGIVSVSAGLLFGLSYLSRQRGRTIRYNKKYIKDKRYMGMYSLITTGNIDIELNEWSLDEEENRVPFEDVDGIVVQDDISNTILQISHRSQGNKPLHLFRNPPDIPAPLSTISVPLPPADESDSENLPHRWFWCSAWTG